MNNGYPGIFDGELAGTRFPGSLVRAFPESRAPGGSAATARDAESGPVRLPPVWKMAWSIYFYLPLITVQ